MSAGKMTLDYLVAILTNQGLIAWEEAQEVALAARREVSALTKTRGSARTLIARDREAEDLAVEALASLNLPLPGGRLNQTVDEEAIIKAVARQEDIPFRKIDPMELDLDLVTKTLPRSFAEAHLVVPVGLQGDTLEVAVCDPFNLHVLDDVRRVTDYKVTPVLSTRSDIKKLINEFYGFKTSIAGAQDQIGLPLTSVDFGNLEQYVRLKSGTDIQATDQHVKNAVDYLFTNAFDQRASDIHVEPKRDETLVRMRIDGVLHNLHRLPKVLHSAIVSRVKSISRMDIAEKRRPQDGRIKIDHEGKEVEIRVSTVPVAFGEKLVMRILDPDVLFRSLSDLFFSREDLDKYRKFVDQPHGMILVTGPTGSGKSTTLYSTLRSLSSHEKNITTIEDPIEMIHEDFNQIAVQPAAGVTFGTILRHILRQDPDIIMVGEMRDYETAENAIQAALTGHLVLSTLHTNDAPSAVTRLVDLGVERFLVASTVIGVIAQRLLRRVCRYCSEEFILPPEEAVTLGLREVPAQGLKLMKGAGCERCRNTGYLGRLATVEVMPMSEQIRQLIMSGEEAKAIKQVARKEGLTTLRENALQIMLQGETTYQEVLRVTVED
ncbi:MAG: ATPase, T2SS/T4P/T4SS family [Thermodesulfobacteriota bacterium]